MIHNLAHLLKKSLETSKKKHPVLSSVVLGVIVQTFLEEKNIDISSSILSVKLQNNVIFIKTLSPLINGEILLIQNILLENISQKLLNLGYTIKNLKIIVK